MKTRVLLIVLLLQLACLDVTQAITQSWKSNRVSNLEKVTVGPWDNFSATTVNDSEIFFTRDSNQISNIFYQNLNTGEVKRYIGESGDAKQATLSADGKLLALTYYKNDAQGDICLLTILDKSIECITSKDTVDQTAFWINATTLGYIRRSSSRLNWDLVEYDLKNKKSKILSSGLISAPVASPDGRYILFNQLLDSESVIQIFDRQNNAIRKMEKFDLSGISGFSTFSRDSKYVYFNHYLNDTNADQKIDGADNSVIFRIPFRRWISATSPVFPEQLTSVNNNCKFPTLSNQYLYVTCAFEGSLDIYRLSQQGVVPGIWNEEQLWEAHQSTRSYEQRLLLLNSIRYRFGVENHTLLERILSNHLEIGELTAASFYIQRLIGYYNVSKKTEIVDFYQALGELITVRSSKQRVPVNIVTTRFQKVVEKAKGRLKSISLRKQSNALISAYLDYELEEYESALDTLRTIDFGAKLLPLERYLLFELYQQLLQPNNAEELLSLYPKMFNESRISGDSRLYYAFNYLKLMNAMDLSYSRRSELVTQQNDQVKFESVKELFAVEKLSLIIAENDDKQIQKKTFKDLKKLLKKHKKDLLLRKAMHTRAIQNLGQASRFSYMELLSRHWLILTNVSEMEFGNVAEQYSVITTNKAYGMMAQRKLAKAYTIFYSAIRQTNDLEAHFQFVTLGMNPTLKKQDNLKKSYELLKKQNLLGENEIYVRALQVLIDAGDKGQIDNKVLDQALIMLREMKSSGLNPAMRDLLMGYIYHSKLRNGKSGYSYNKSLFQKAHHHYMLALDLGRDNTRIAATVWQNLGWLQFEVRQYALAVDFFQHRLALPFINKMDEVSVRWMLARSLFYINEYSEALNQSEITMAFVEKHQLGSRTPYLEKTAFYAMQSENYEKSSQFYEQLLDQHELTRLNETKSRLAYAYSLMKLNKRQQAISEFKKVIALSASLDSVAANEQRLIGFNPKRLQILAYGFLAKIVEEKREVAKYFQNRLDIFRSIKKSASDFSYDEATRLSFITKDLHQLAVVNEQLNDNAAMATAINAALTSAEKWVEETGDEIGPVIYRTLINYLSLNLSYINAFSEVDRKMLEKNVIRTLVALENVPFRSSLLIYQHKKLQVLWISLNKIWGSSASYDDEVSKVLATDEMNLMQKELPEMYEEIKRLIQYFS